MTAVSFNEGFGVLLALIHGAFLPALFRLAMYVLTSLGLYAMARRRGIHNPWLAWIPVGSAWIVGSLADQYRYVVRGEDRSKRKWLAVLSVLKSLSRLVLLAMGMAASLRIFTAFLGGAGAGYMLQMALAAGFHLLGVGSLTLVLSLGCAIVYYVTMYDVFRSMDPANAVTYLVLSILFRIPEPFFLFFNREKDLGMPPRREI